MMAKKGETGDVLKLARAERKAVYLHDLGKHREYGDGVAVCPLEQNADAEISAELFRDSYVTFFPAVAAVANGMASVAGHLPSPGLPKRMRRAGARSEKKVETWIIEDGTSEIVKRELSAAELELPIAAIWNHELLLQRVAEGWRPEMEGTSDDDRVAIDQLPQVSSPGAPHVVLHYLYFAAKSAAVEAAAVLRALGFQIEERGDCAAAGQCRLGADGVNWLVLARHTIVPSEGTISSARRVMEDLARKHNGEYDGWEAEVQQ